MARGAGEEQNPCSNIFNNNLRSSCKLTADGLPSNTPLSPNAPADVDGQLQMLRHSMPHHQQEYGCWGQIEVPQDIRQNKRGWTICIALKYPFCCIVLPSYLFALLLHFVRTVYTMAFKNPLNELCDLLSPPTYTVTVDVVVSFCCNIALQSIEQIICHWIKRRNKTMFGLRFKCLPC